MLRTMFLVASSVLSVGQVMGPPRIISETPVRTEARRQVGDRADVPSVKSVDPGVKSVEAQRQIQPSREAIVKAAAEAAKGDAPPAPEGADAPMIDETPVPPETTSVAQASPPPTTGSTTAKWCDVYISSEDSRDAICVDQSGNYMAEVRQINIWIQPAMKAPSAQLQMWRGLYKPSSAAAVHKEDWKVRSIKTVSKAEIQKFVDQEKPLEISSR